MRVGGGGEEGERRQRIEVAPVRALGVVGRDGDVVGDPQRVEAGVLGGARALAQELGRRLGTHVAQRDVDLHAVDCRSLETRGKARSAGLQARRRSQGGAASGRALRVGYADPTGLEARAPRFPLFHCASSTTTPSGPSRNTSLRSWKTITALRGVTPAAPQAGEIAVEVVGGQAEVVEAALAQRRQLRIGQRRRPQQAQQLHLEARRGAGQHQGVVLGLEVRDAHVAGERLAADHHRPVGDEAEQGEEAFRRLDVADHHGHVIEMGDHRLPQGASPTTAARAAMATHSGLKIHVSRRAKRVPRTRLKKPA